MGPIVHTALCIEDEGLWDTIKLLTDAFVENKFQRYIDDEEKDFYLEYLSDISSLEVPSPEDGIKILHRFNLISLYLPEEIFNDLWSMWKEGHDSKKYKKVLKNLFVKIDDFDKTILFMFYMESLVRKEALEDYLSNRDLTFDFIRGKINTNLCFLPLNDNGELPVEICSLSKTDKIITRDESLYSEFKEGINSYRAKLAVHELLLMIKLQTEPLVILLSQSLSYFKGDYLNKELDLSLNNVTREDGINPSFVLNVIDGLSKEIEKKRKHTSSPLQVANFYRLFLPEFEKLDTNDFADSSRKRLLSFGLKEEEITLESIARTGKIKRTTARNKVIEIIAERFNLSEELIKSYADTLVTKKYEVKKGRKFSEINDNVAFLINDMNIITNFLHLPYEVECNILVADVIQETHFLMEDIYLPSICSLPEVLIEELLKHQDKVKVKPAS